MFEGIFQPLHLLVILLVALLFFGPKKLGDLGKGLGEGIRDFKKALRDDQSQNTNTTPKPKVDLPSELVGKSAEEVAAYYQAKEREAREHEAKERQGK